MTHRLYAVVWIDHREAEIFQLDATQDTKIVVNSHSSVQRQHHQGADTEFFARIVSALNHTGGTLLAGPGETRHDLDHYLRSHRPDLGAHVVQLETVGHPRDGELVALARRHFKLAA